MPELEEDIRATAPQPREEFLARLDKRVEAGFAQPKRPRRTWALRRSAGTSSLWRPGLALAVTVLLAGVGVIAALNSQSSDDQSGDAAVSQAEPAAGESAGGNAVTRGGPASEESAARDIGPGVPAPPVAPAPQDQVAPGSEPRKVERRTALELAAPEDDFAEVTAGVLRVADATGTIVQRSNVTEQDGRGFATYDLRVPASRLDDALAELSRLADVRSRSSSSDDITAAFVSARDRLTDARDERRALLRALERADSERERDAIRARLREARERIARAERDVRRVKARTDRARVDVTVRSTGESGAWTPGDALDDAGRILEVVAGVILVAGAVLAPLLLLLGAAVITARIVRRRRRNAVLG